ncbi:uncharacterized protein LOC142352966 [Convolutriloba macropyga]|uniref:uncharacterized protein LOC142352966 n=1 Tax=Convolutriloba macropyga TaxID=536237 RepID=UPI003F51DD4F
MEVSRSIFLYLFAVCLAVTSVGMAFCGHGSYGATSSYLRIGLWKICYKYLKSESCQCQNLDFWERSIFNESEKKIKASRGLLISDHVVGFIVLLLLLLYHKSDNSRPNIVRVMLPLAAIHTLILNFAVGLAEMAYDRLENLDLGWSQIVPLIGAAFSVGQFILIALVCVFDAREMAEDSGKSSKGGEDTKNKGGDKNDVDKEK